VVRGVVRHVRPTLRLPLPESPARIPTAPVVAAGLAGGFAVARYSGYRDLGGALFVTAGLWCAWAWQRRSGPGAMGVLGGVYAAAFGVSHPLAKKIGAWPSVLTVSAVASAVTHLVADRDVA
jgi:hypothetical protein